MIYCLNCHLYFIFNLKLQWLKMLKIEIFFYFVSFLWDKLNFDKLLGLQEATRYYLEILGNTLIRPATAKFLVQRAGKLSDIPTKNLQCPWLNLEFLKHRDKDRIESIFK